MKLRLVKLEEKYRGYLNNMLDEWYSYDEERDVFVGAINIRHYLNERLLLNGGHIGDGIL